jgi:hypothetical protein
VDLAATLLGIFAYITDDDTQALQSTLEIILRRFAEYHSLEGAFTCRATIERQRRPRGIRSPRGQVRRALQPPLARVASPRVASQIPTDRRKGA